MTPLAAYLTGLTLISTAVLAAPVAACVSCIAKGWK